MGSVGAEEINLASPALLDKIDKLREIGVSNFIALPQLVVVGDQSSGKSSVLEGLTQLPFPRDSGLCTRFATQITFKRTPEKTISVSIIPSPSSTGEKKEKVQAYRKEGLKSLKGHEFLKILGEVCEVMGIPGPNQTLKENQPSFSEDVLKIELCGPDRQHLTVIDIPGIFRTPQAGVTTKDDMALVRRIVHQYICDDRTIILAVIPAPVDIATQEILSMAEEVDPNGIRTLGVLTKPDLVDKGGEHNVMDLVRNKKHKLKLGYCIVRNRGQQELLTDSDERLRKERNFFASEPWCELDKDRVGTEALQDRLRELLQDITRREFPKVKQQIDRQLLDCKENLRSLGSARDTPEQQRKYLQAMAIEYGKVTDAAVDAYYARHNLFSKLPELRLPTLIVDRSDRFSTEIEKKGHTINFLAKDDLVDESDRPEDVAESMMKALNISIERENYSELYDIVDFDWECPGLKKGSILDWIEDEYQKTRGQGLVSLSPAVIPTVWQEQCRNWEGLTLNYMSDIVLFVHNFTHKLLEQICPDERVRSSLLSMLMEPMLEQYKKAVDHAKFIIKVECCGTLLTHNHYYNSNLQKSRISRMKLFFKPHAKPMAKTENGPLQGEYVDIDAIATSLPIGNREHDVKEIHDILKSYYKVARKRFVDAICMQACDYHLISSDDSPLRIFSPPFISGLSDSQLDIIAGEDLSSRRQRKSLNAEIEALEMGKKLLRA